MKDKIRAKIRQYFYYNKVESYGIFALFVLFLLAILTFTVFENKQEDTTSVEAFFRLVDSLESLEEEQNVIALHSFNPNTVDSLGLDSLGFSSKQIQNLLHYRKAGGIFRAKSDFRKLYFVTDSVFVLYEPYLEIKLKQPTRKKSKAAVIKKPKREIKLFYFDPNSITEKDWGRLGISAKVAKIISHYLEKGGHFSKAEDLKKIYGFTESDYKRIAPYVRIANKEKKPIKPKVVFDINTVNNDELEKLGIRKTVVARVLKFRDALGGYYDLAQLSEVYGIRQSELKKLQSNCGITQSISRININTASVRKLSRHPYISLEVAQSIVRYRKRNGFFKNIVVLKNAKILSDKAFEKAKKYLKVEN